MGADNHGNVMLLSLPFGRKDAVFMDAICPLLSSPPSLPDAERKQKLVPGNTVPRTRGWLCDMGALLIEINDMWGKQVGDGDLRFKSDKKLSERVLCIRFLCIKGVRQY